MKAYHGSLVDITDAHLKPNRAFSRPDYTNCVYISLSYTNALLYSVNPIKSFLDKTNRFLDARAFSAHIDFTQEIPIVYELYDGMFEELFNVRCFIYECEIEETQSNHHNQEIKIEHPVAIIRKIEILNFYQELISKEKAGEIKLIRFDDWEKSEYNNFISDIIACRATLIETEGERIFFREKFKDCLEVQFSIQKRAL